MGIQQIQHLNRFSAMSCFTTTTSTTATATTETSDTTTTTTTEKSDTTLLTFVACNWRIEKWLAIHFDWNILIFFSLDWIVLFSSRAWLNDHIFIPHWMNLSVILNDIFDSPNIHKSWWILSLKYKSNLQFPDLTLPSATFSRP